MSALSSTPLLTCAHTGHGYHLHALVDFVDIRAASAPIFKCGACADRRISLSAGKHRIDDGNHDPKRCAHMRFVGLVLSFHSLKRASGVWPWEPLKFARWVRTQAYSHGEQCAGRFILAVWNAADFNRGKTRFDVIDAMTVWDEGNRKAFQAWVAAPWWP